MNPYKFLFRTNLILTLIIMILLVLADQSHSNDKEKFEYFFLLILGLYQIITSLTLMVLSIFKNKNLLILYVIYWGLVFAFFWNIFNLFKIDHSEQNPFSKYCFYAVLIAVYNVFISNRSFSESEKNIFRL